MGLADKDHISELSDSSAIKICYKGRPECVCTHCAVRFISICAALDQDELEELEAMSQSASFPPKAGLFSQDEPVISLFSITEGVVRLYKLLPDGRRQIVGFALPGDFLGSSLPARFGVSADAVTSVVACRFSRQGFSTYIDDKPRLLKKLHEFASNELTLAQEQIVLLGRRSAEERIAAFLISLRDRMRRVGHVSVTLSLPMSRQDIADFLGLTIETVSRTFTKLAKDKRILIVPDGVRLTDPDRLEQLATG